MSAIDCDLPEFYSHSEPVAAKEHRCCECAAPILKGEKHFFCTGKWFGEVQSYRQHLDCCEACMLIRDKFNGDECIGFGALKEEFEELRSDNWYPERYHEPWKKLRSLMAKILWRERKHWQQKAKEKHEQQSRQVP